MLPGGLKAEELADFSWVSQSEGRTWRLIKEQLPGFRSTYPSSETNPSGYECPLESLFVSLLLQSFLVYNLSISATRKAALERPRAGLERWLSGWRACCSSRGPEFKVCSQHMWLSGSQQPVTPAPGGPRPSTDLQRHTPS